MLFTVLLAPLAMVLAGLFLWKWAPAEPNGLIGYRTSYSLKNKETWAFAQAHSGRLWIKTGTGLLLLSAVGALFLAGRGLEETGMAAAVFIFVQLAAMLAACIPTEMALRRTFDAEGRRK